MEVVAGEPMGMQPTSPPPSKKSRRSDGQPERPDVPPAAHVVQRRITDFEAAVAKAEGDCRWYEGPLEWWDAEDTRRKKVANDHKQRAPGGAVKDLASICRRFARYRLQRRYEVCHRRVQDEEEGRHVAALLGPPKAPLLPSVHVVRPTDIFAYGIQWSNNYMIITNQHGHV